MLLILLSIIILSLFLAVLFTPAVIKVAFRCNLVDRPDNKRKIHIKPIPRVGGVALGAAYFLSLLATAVFVGYQQPTAGSSFAVVKSIALPALLVFVIGLADDIFNLKPWPKLAFQILAAAMVVYQGVHIHGIPTLDMHPGLEAAGTVMWLVFCTNAVNLIDGLDGLAAGIALLATVTIFTASLVSGNIGLALATAPLAGALLGFLRFNFAPASVFLGDSGSLLLGFLIGCYSVVWSGTSTTVVRMAAPLLMLAVPLLDTTLAIARRFLRKQPIFKPDHSHIHHQLLARGLSHRDAVLLLYVMAGIAGSLALSLVWAQDLWEGVVISVFVAAVVFGVSRLGYAEFEALIRVILRAKIRHEIGIQLAVQTFAQSLRAAVTADECWKVIQSGCTDFNFDAIRMQLAGSQFHSDDQRESQQRWIIDIPLSEQDSIRISQKSDLVPHPSAPVLFANTVRRVLADKNFHEVAIEEKPAILSTSLYGTAA